MLSAKDVVNKLNLQPHPEGGFYRRTYESALQINANNLGSTRPSSTAILFLIDPFSFSALHRVKSDEIFHFYAGDSAEMIQIDATGILQRFNFGSNIAAGEIPQIVVPAGSWQGLRVKSGGSWTLLGATVSPGFDFSDFEMGQRDILIEQFPQLKKEIEQFTRT